MKNARSKRKSRFQKRGEQEDNSTKRTPPNPHLAAQQSSPKPVQDAEGNQGNKSPEKSSESPSTGARADSPEPSCSICLGKLENKSFTDSCFHTFCFVCLMEWSKVKAVCPLCKQPFKSIIHNVRSIEDYDQYHLKPEDSGSFGSGGDGQRFRYRTTMTLTRQLTHRANRDHQHYALLPTSITTRTQWRRLRETATSNFRRRVYTSGLRVETVNMAAGRPTRQREVNPQFFTRNPACTHRLVPWLNRELNVLLGNRQDHVQFVLELILDLVKRFDIHSEEFFEHIQPFFGSRTDHFIHEFYNFARSPYDMVAYDRHAVYNESQGEVETVEDSSDDSSEGNDSDVIVLSPEEGERQVEETTSSSPSPSNRPSQYQPRISMTRNPEPPFELRHQFEWDLTPLLSRVRNFLSSAQDTSVSGWDSPTPGPSSVLAEPSRNDSPPPTLSPQLSSRSDAGVKTEKDGRRPKNSESSESQATGSGSESHRSGAMDNDDVIFICHDKPWERPPIVISSDSEDESERVSTSSRRSSQRRSGEERSKRHRRYSSSEERSTSRHRSSSRKRTRKGDRSRSQSRGRRSLSRRERDYYHRRGRSRSVSRSREERGTTSKRDRDYHRYSDHSQSRYSSAGIHRDVHSRDRHRPEGTVHRKRSRSRSPRLSGRLPRSYDRRSRSRSQSGSSKTSSGRNWHSRFLSNSKSRSRSPRSSLKLRLSKNNERRSPYHETARHSHAQRSSSESVEFLTEKKRKKKHHKKHKKHKKHKHHKKDNRHSDSDVELLGRNSHQSDEETGKQYKKHPTGHKKSRKTTENENTTSDCLSADQVNTDQIPVEMSAGTSSWSQHESAETPTGDVSSRTSEGNVTSASSSESVAMSSPESVVSSVTTWSSAAISAAESVTCIESGSSSSVLELSTANLIPVSHIPSLPGIESVLPDNWRSLDSELVSFSGRSPAVEEAVVCVTAGDRSKASSPVSVVSCANDDVAEVCVPTDSETDENVSSCEELEIDVGTTDLQEGERPNTLLSNENGEELEIHIPSGDEFEKESSSPVSCHSIGSDSSGESTRFEVKSSPLISKDRDSDVQLEHVELSGNEGDNDAALSCDSDAMFPADNQFEPDPKETETARNDSEINISSDAEPSDSLEPRCLEGASNSNLEHVQNKEQMAYVCVTSTVDDKSPFHPLEEEGSVQTGNKQNEEVDSFSDVSVRNIKSLCRLTGEDVSSQKGASEGEEEQIGAVARTASVEVHSLCFGLEEENGEQTESEALIGSFPVESVEDVQTGSCLTELKGSVPREEAETGSAHVTSSVQSPCHLPTRENLLLPSTDEQKQTEDKCADDCTAVAGASVLSQSDSEKNAEKSSKASDPTCTGEEEIILKNASQESGYVSMCSTVNSIDNFLTSSCDTVDKIQGSNLISETLRNSYHCDGEKFYKKDSKVTEPCHSTEKQQFVSKVMDVERVDGPICEHDSVCRLTGVALPSSTGSVSCFNDVAVRQHFPVQEVAKDHTSAPSGGDTLT